MKTVSPLRYPGGKSSLSDLISRIRRLNGLGSLPVTEPFAGGAGAALSLLFLEDTPEIYINDIDSSVYDFWWSLLNRSATFLKLVANTPVSLDEWHRQRQIYRSSRKVSRIRRGFATFYLNRCNRSGIIMNGGPIGGNAQTGKWKVDARYNKNELLRRCERIAHYRERIELSKQDGLELLQEQAKSDRFFFIDPPYFDKGKTLYLNSLSPSYHQNLALLLKSKVSAAWILTYDDCPEIRSMYKNWANVRSFSLRYVAAGRRVGKEILISPKWMRLPEFQSSSAIDW